MLFPLQMRPIALIPLFGTTLIVATWAATLLQLSVDEKVVLDRALQDTQAIAVAYEQDTLRTLKAADRWLLRVKYEIEANGHVNLTEMMANSVLSPEDIGRAAIADAAGHITAKTRDMKSPDVDHQAYFRRQKAQDTGKLDISEPLIGRVSKESIVVLSRRLNGGDGGFAGVVAIAVHPSSLTHFYQESQLGKHGIVSVLGRSGSVLASREGKESVVPADGRVTDPSATSATSLTGSYRGKGAVDGVDRLVAYRTLENYPVIVAVGQATDEVLANFHHQRVLYLAIATIATASIAIFFAIVTLLAVRLGRHATLERERADAARLASKVFEAASDGIVISDCDDRVVMVNAALSRLTGYEAAEIVGKVMAESPFGPLDRTAFEERMMCLMRDGRDSGEVPHFRKDGQSLSLWLSASTVRNADGSTRNYIRIFTDISQVKSSQRALEAAAGSLREANTMLVGEIAERARTALALRCSNEELAQSNVRLQEAQGRVLQSEKLAAIGQLAAGVAHEINNPIGYVLSNFGILERYIHSLFEMLAAYEAATVIAPSEASLAAVAAMRDKVEVDYLKEDIPTLMTESKEGISRVCKIVEDLRDFSRTDNSQQWLRSNLHAGIDSTLNIVNSEIRFRADVIKEYGDLPEVECLPTQLNQVFMNLLVNAAHAMDKPRGRIVIRSGTEGDQAWVEIADDGSGMPADVKSRVFDPFFTTKPVGQGTGLGLSLSYGIIQRHNGRIDLESEVGKGTTFRVWLPIRRRVDSADVHGAVLPAEPLAV